MDALPEEVSTCSSGNTKSFPSCGAFFKQFLHGRLPEFSSVETSLRTGVKRAGEQSRP
jgi:hypothetical protein